MSNSSSSRVNSISVAIPNWNGERILPQCLAALRRAYDVAGLTAGLDIVIADDQSADRSAEIVRRGFPEVQWIDMPQRSGFGVTANTAVQACRHGHVLLLNNDVLLAEDFFVHWSRHFENPDTFAVASWMLRWDRKTVDSGRRIAVWDKGLIRHWVVEDRGVAAPSLYACGGASVYDRQKFLAVGGFDRLYRPMYTEDFDLSYMAWKRGWPTLYEPRCVAYHHNSYSSGKAFSQRKKFLNDTKNHFLLVWKNVTDPVLWDRHLAWLPLRIAAAPFHGRRMLTAAFFVALRQIGEARRRRREERAFARMTDREIFAIVQPTEHDLAHSPRQGLAGAC
jgi:GT2 family glycosyltransferase